MCYKDEKWKNRYLDMAANVATWSKDPSRKIGAVIVGTKGQIISQGFNGFPRGIEDSKERYDDRPTKYKYVVHAELNAIFNAAYNGSTVEGSTIFVSGLPVCHDCARAVIQTGIKHVVMNTKPADTWKESGDLSLSMFDEAGVTYEFIESEK